MKKLLLLSASRVGDTDYLAHAKGMLDEHLSTIKNVVFIPYAGVTMTYDEYTNKVQQALSDLPISIKGIHQFDDPKHAIESAEAIMIGGGNTFRLLERLYHFNLFDIIRDKVNSGVAYVGWSAGSNIAGLSIKTTNDMPIIQPDSFNALALVNFQLNPHYTDHTPPGHNGETREQRLQEFMVLNPDTQIVGLIEGTALKVIGNDTHLIGEYEGYLFLNGQKSTLPKNSNISALVN
ncbi:dipeptidase PepE [Thalassotalea ganghwensis]